MSLIERNLAMYYEWRRTGGGGYTSENVKRIARKHGLRPGRTADICFAVRRAMGLGPPVRACMKTRNAEILALSAQYPCTWRGGRGKICEGSMTWMARRLGVSRSVIAGVLHRSRASIAARYRRDEGGPALCRVTPSSPRRFSWDLE